MNRKLKGNKMASNRNTEIVEASGADLINIFPEPRTELARLALKARAEYIATGAPLLDSKAINAEVAERRGGYQDER
jgi:hypothetical protein